MVSLIAFLISVIIAYMAASQLRNYGADIYVVDLITVGVLRDPGGALTGARWLLRPQVPPELADALRRLDAALYGRGDASAVPVQQIARQISELDSKTQPRRGLAPLYAS